MTTDDTSPSIASLIRRAKFLFKEVVLNDMDASVQVVLDYAPGQGWESWQAWFASFPERDSCSQHIEDYGDEYRAGHRFVANASSPELAVKSLINWVKTVKEVEAEARIEREEAEANRCWAC